MSGLTMARLRKMATVATGKARRLAVVSGPDGRRWAAWPHGCIELTDQQHGWLDRPKDGCYRMRSDGLALAEYVGFGADLVRREMLPLVTATNRTPVAPTPWMYEDSGHVRRILERSDGQRLLVDADLWQAWTAVVDGPVWQIGAPNGWLVWASTATAPGVATLGPVRAKSVPVPPEVAA